MTTRETWLITGASGILGHALTSRLVDDGVRVVGVARHHPVLVPGVETRCVDLLDFAAVRRLVDEIAPTHIVHAAGLTDVDACERNENVALALHAKVCAALVVDSGKARLAYISTDHLWDGSLPLVSEDEPPKPLNAYARTKLAGEEAALEADPGALIVRTNFFGPGPEWRKSYSDWVIASLRSGVPFTAFEDVYFTPIAHKLLAQMLVRLARSSEGGIWHLAGGERLSKFDFTLRLARHLGLPETNVRKGRVTDAHLAALRPRDMSLGTAKAAAWFTFPMPTIEESFAVLTGLEITD